MRGSYESALVLEAETLVRTTTTTDVPGVPPRVDEESNRVEATILYLVPRFSVEGCNEQDGSARYKLTIKVTGCGSISGQGLPRGFPECLHTGECRCVYGRNAILCTLPLLLVKVTCGVVRDEATWCPAGAAEEWMQYH